MKMPTDRRGRFLFYRARQRRRLKKVYNRAPRKWFDMEPGTNRTGRQYDLSEFTKQTPRGYPLHFPEKSLTAEDWLLAGWTPPERGRWGVARGWPYYPPTRPPWFRFADTQVGYYDRRVKSIPRLKHLTRLPWKFTHADIRPGDYFPFDNYPSGAPSYRSTLPD